MIRIAHELWAICLTVAVGCSAPPAREPAPVDPFAAVEKADAEAKQGDNEGALRDYLWALDHGKEVSPSFVAARRGLIEKIVALGTRYPPSRAALAERLDRRAKDIIRAAETGGTIEPLDLALFVWLGTRTGDEARVQATYSTVRARLPADAPLRLQLWAPLERFLVEARRYKDAAAESDGKAVVEYYLRALTGESEREEVKQAIAFTIENECGSHYEALVGAGQTAAAEALAEKLVKFSSTGKTYAVLISRARRAGAEDVAKRLRGSANEVLPEMERKTLDEAVKQ